MPREIEVRFSVTGTCTQTIEVADDCGLTDAEIVESLNGQGNHTVVTTVQEGGDLDQMSETESKTIGKVISSDVDAEYEDFELT